MLAHVVLSHLDVGRAVAAQARQDVITCRCTTAAVGGCGGGAVVVIIQRVQRGRQAGQRGGQTVHGELLAAAPNRTCNTSVHIVVNVVVVVMVVVL